MSVRLKQLAQDGATNGQVLVYNSTSGLWEPGAASGGGGPDFESALLNRSRSEIGVAWTAGASVDITTSGVYEIVISGVVASDSATVGSVQLRLLRDGVPLSGYALDRDGDGVFFDHRPSIVWAPFPFHVRLLIYSDGTETYSVEHRNSDGSTYHALGETKLRAYRVSDLEAVDAISTRIGRFHADRANYAYDNSAGPVDWWSDAFTGYKLQDGTPGGGVYGPDGFSAGVDTIDVGGTAGGWTGNIPGHAGTNHTFLFVIRPDVATGDFRNLLRFTPAGSELGFLQSHESGGSAELGYIYGHSGSVQKLGVAGTTANQSLAVVFDKTTNDEVRVYRNGVEIASASLTGQTGQTLSATNQGWFCFPTSSGFACICGIREVFAFSNALDLVTADWNTLNDYVAAEYGLDDRP